VQEVLSTFLDITGKNNKMLTLFGCPHSNYSWPQKLKEPEQTPTGVQTHYAVCTKCGQEFYYNWKEMKLGKKREVPQCSNSNAKNANASNFFLKQEA
jgi:hypothetical protein